MTAKTDAREQDAGQGVGGWAGPVLLSAVAAMAVGTILVIVGVHAAGLLMPGVWVLDVALLLLAVAGVLGVLTRDD